MKEKPILFTGPMVRAILDGPKSQTRRVVKLPIIDRNGTGCELGASELSQSDMQYCPYGQTGDRLYVKEAFCTCPKCDCFLAYKANQELPVACEYCGQTARIKWKPSIFMRRQTSRITLEVTAVRVERLQDISKEDVLAEGVHVAFTDTASIGEFHACYRALWDSINGKTHPWKSNPWVWVIEFKKL